MARSVTRGRSGLGSSVRRGLHAHKQRMSASFPRPSGATALAQIEAGVPIEMDSASLFAALYAIDPGLAEPYAHRHDRDNRRRFLLDANDVLTELPMETT